MGSPNLLHTKAEKYGNFGIIFPSFRSAAELGSRATALRAKEIAFYNSFIPGCNSYEAFIKALRELFKNMAMDANVLKAFRNADIEKEFKNFGLEIGYKLNEGIEITYSLKEEEIDIKNLLSGIPGVEVEGGKITISKDVDEDIVIIKKVFNSVLGTKFDTQGKGKNNKRRLNEFLDKVQSGGDLAINELTRRTNFSITGLSGGIKTAKAIIKTPGIFNYNIQNIRDAENDPKLKAEIDKAISQVRNFIMSIADRNNASQMMRNAIRDTWIKSFSGEKMRAAFFEKKGYVDYLKGAFGEFQAALLKNYVALATGNNNLPKALISDTVEKGEQQKTDVELLRGIGAQVKNINLFATPKIESNMHFQRFVDAAGLYFEVESFGGFLANYFFNETYKSENSGNFDELKNILGDYYAELMNLAVTDSIDDVVTFYIISGEYLVPGSEILDENIFPRMSVEITSSYDGKSDDQYLSETREKDDRPLFLEWWKPERGAVHSFYPTGRNHEDFNNILSKVSIRTGFSHGGDLGRYSLFRG